MLAPGRPGFKRLGVKGVRIPPVVGHRFRGEWANYPEDMSRPFRPKEATLRAVDLVVAANTLVLTGALGFLILRMAPGSRLSTLSAIGLGVVYRLGGAADTSVAE
jgi:hypothetical protein